MQTIGHNVIDQDAIIIYQTFQVQISNLIFAAKDVKTLKHLWDKETKTSYIVKGRDHVHLQRVQSLLNFNLNSVQTLLVRQFQRHSHPTDCQYQAIGQVYFKLVTKSLIRLNSRIRANLLSLRVPLINLQDSNKKSIANPRINLSSEVKQSIDSIRIRYRHSYNLQTHNSISHHLKAGMLTMK